MSLPLENLIHSLRRSGIVRFVEHFAGLLPTGHLKDVIVDEVLPDRVIGIQGRRVVNFGSDSFLGLDQHPRVRDALIRGLRKWGTHNGASRAFSSVHANIEAEEKLANWLGTEAVLIFPSVTLVNLGALPGLVSKPDLLVVDEHAHNSIQDGAQIAKGNGVRVLKFAHGDPEALERVLKTAGDYRVAVVAIDGVYSMTGAVPPLAELNEVALRHNAVLYVDDAHGTAIMGQAGRGTVLDALGSYANTLVVGSLSKGFSCLGGFIGCSAEMKRILKMRSNTYIFGGPVPPPYLEAIGAVCDILLSPEYGGLIARLLQNVEQFVTGARRIGFQLMGARSPIVSVFVGDEEETLRTGQFLFERGFFVQSVTFPAVPYHAGVIRVQINANHRPDQIDGLLAGFAAISRSASKVA